MSDPATVSMSTSSMSDLSQRPAIIMPMPVPGMPDAPKFEGRDAKEFLEQIEAHGQRAGITDQDRLVDYIVRYSSRAIRSDIRFMPEFDAEVENKTWSAAKRMLLQMFSAHEEPPDVSIRDLEDCCIIWSKEEPLAKKSNLDRYQRRYFSIVAPLLKQNALTNELKGYYFLQGLPKKDQKFVEKKLPAETKKKSNPPTVEEVIKIIHQKIENKDFILHHHWDSEDEDVDDIRQRIKSKLSSREDDSDEEGEIKVRRRSSSKSDKNSSDKGRKKKVRIVEEEEEPEWKGKQAMEEITKCMEELSLSMARMASSRAGASSRTDGVRFCFICGVPHAEGSVPAKCPEMQNLVRENLINYDYISRKYTLPNGQDLPRVPYGTMGGMAGMLRAQNGSRSNPGSTDASNPVLSASPATLSYGNATIFGQNVFGVSSLDQGGIEEEMERQVYPSLRSGRDTSARFNPSNQQGRENRRRAEHDPNGYDKPGFRPPEVRGKVPSPTIRTEEIRKDTEPKGPKVNIDIPPPTNPVNRQEGWRESQPSSSKGKGKEREDVEMTDSKDRKSGHSQGQGFHYTSDLQKRADPKRVLDKVLGTDITVSLAELVGCSPALQKMISEVARTRREYGKEVVSAIVSEYVDESEEAFVDEGDVLEEGQVSAGLHVAEEDRPRLQKFLRTYASAVTQSTTKYYAMVTGIFTVFIRGRAFRAMIDTGSELNVGDEDIPSKTGLPMDLEGMKWGLKGIHGQPEQLRGVIVDLPMKIGKYEFPHHLFISKNKLNPNWDIILGQPFLQWYACRIDYWRAGHMQLLLWNDGDKERVPHITLALTDPEDKRNQNSINRYSGENRPRAIGATSIDDEEFFGEDF
ncbi:hypothetical protein F5880DRAFT_1633931 [Lentinula raphanica]|nr:hypothetical protein F5880DRAFT_1633931 [Lentinula raphanica]